MHTTHHRARPSPDRDNIYTPNAGHMIIHVQRQSGFASRTIVLSERKVRLLRHLLSRKTVVFLALAIASWTVLAIQAARVPALVRRVSDLQRTAGRIDSLTTALDRAHASYERLERMLGALPRSARVTP